MIEIKTKDDEIDLRQLFFFLWVNKWLIVIFVSISLVMALSYLFITKPVFLADSLIQVEQKQSGLGDFGDLESLMGGESSLDTEVEIIKSRYVLGKVVDQLFLQINIKPKYLPLIGEFLAWRYQPEIGSPVNSPMFNLNKFNTGGEYIKVSAMSVPEILANKVLLLKVEENDFFSLYDHKGIFLLRSKVGLEGKSTDQSVVILISQLRANVGAEFNLSINKRIDSINSLRRMLKVTLKGKKSNVMSLSIEGTDRVKIVAVLNKLVNVYKEQNIQRLSEEAEKSIEFLSVQVPAVRRKLESAEQNLNDYRSSINSLNMEIETASVLKQIVSIEEQLNRLELKENEISSRYKEDHPVYASLIRQKSSLVLEKDKMEVQVESLPATQQKLLRLMRDVEVSNVVYLQLLNKMEELKVIRAGTVGNVRILDYAAVQSHSVKPKKPIVLFGAFIIGVALSLCFIITVRLFKSGMVNPNEIQEKYSLPCYGVIPLSKAQQRVEQVTSSRHNKVLAEIDEADLSLEAIRSVRTSLHFAMMDAKNNIVMLTGPSPGIGKSFVSLNLAALIGKSGQRVLLVDADMRRGHINKSFHKPRMPGLSNLLSDSRPYCEFINENVMENVDFISTGSVPPNPSELLMSSNFSSFLDSARKDYDIVLIDTPPVLAVTDAKVVGKQAGTTMLVVRHMVNTSKEIQQVLVDAEQLDVVIKGYIYNFMEYDGSSAYNDRYYNYKYESLTNDS